jgi:hypothetical protein
MARPDDNFIAYLSGEDGGESLSDHQRAELDDVRALLKAPATWAQPDADLEDRVVAAVTEEAQARPRGPARSKGLARLAGARAASRGLRGPLALRRPALALGAVAAVIAAVVIGVAVNNTSPPPQQFAMVISGTGLAPYAHGSATLTKTSSGWRIELSASGLPHLANGRYYEAWLKNRAGVLVPVGTFNDARRVTLWAGVRPPEFPTLTVTRQQASGNPASSGQRVLTGTIRATH